VTRYEITGRTGTFFTDRAIGEIFEDDLDEDTERTLLDVGAVRILPDEKKPEPKKPAAKSTTSKSR
jgi:hypothetical protein